MKRIGNLYKRICNINNIKQAHKKASKDKMFYREVKMVNSDEDRYLKAIQDMLINKTYYVGADDYRVSKMRDKVKWRELWKLNYYPHRIIQRAIMLQLESMFINTFCYHVCASIPGRGIKRALELLDKYLKDKAGTKYCLKLDVHQFYPSVNHKILKQLLRKKIKDKNLLWLLDMIIDSYPGEIGLPIGSYLSQYLANYYLAFFDHYLKEELGLEYVIRYMDDIIILSDDKEHLRGVLNKIQIYLSGLELELKPNYQIFPTDSRGIDFVGYRSFHGYRLLRKRTKNKIKRTCKAEKVDYHIFCSINSHIGWLLPCNHHRLYIKHILPTLPKLAEYYETNISNNKKRIRKYKKKLWNKRY